MGYKWKPSAAQRREFAENMQNPEYAREYEQRKEDRAAKKRAKSRFNYKNAGGMYIPTRQQHDFCINNMQLTTTHEIKLAFDMVIYGFTCTEKISHDHIHIVNGHIRLSSNF